MKERPRTVGRIVRPLIAAVAIFTSGCEHSEQPLQASYEPTALLLLDTRGGKPYLGGLPDFGEKSIIIRPDSPFYAICEAKKVFGKEKVNLEAAQKGLAFEDDQLREYYVTPDNRKYIVDEKQAREHSISAVEIHIDGKVVKRREAPSAESSVPEDFVLVEASDFPQGKHEVNCTFETRDGVTYTAKASLEIKS